MTAVLEIKDLSISFSQKPNGSRVVNNLNFTLKQGQTLALVGESGSGKSVTALSILKLLPQAHYPHGHILFEKQDLLKANDQNLQAIRGKKIAMIFQEPMVALNPLHTIEKQLRESIQIHAPLMSSDLIKKRVLSLLEEVGFSDGCHRLKAYPHQLSGGQRQRVMIAMALACEPSVIIADEPTTALDVTTQIQILDVLKSLQKNYNMAILLITHNMGVVRYLAHEVIVMKAGVSLEQGPVSILDHPQHPYTQKLMASEPSGHPPIPGPKTLLTCTDLEVSYETKKFFTKKSTQSLYPLSFSLKQGETLGIVGESGSGKSTLALALLQLIPHKGTTIVNGMVLNNLKTKALRQQRRYIQGVFQDPYGSLNPRMTVYESVAEGLRVHEPHLQETDMYHKVCRILEKVGLSQDICQRYPHAFSGGQRQRIAIARALILNPLLMVLDEPTSALDRTIQLDIIHLLRQLQKDLGLSYIFISHDLHVIKAMAHQIIVLQRGRVVEAGSCETLFYHPQHSHTQHLIRAIL